MKVFWKRNRSRAYARMAGVFSLVFLLIGSPACTDDSRTSKSNLILSTTDGLMPAAEAVGESSPFRLTLSLLETKIKPGDSLWYRISIQNIGDREIKISDRFLVNPGQLRNNTELRRNVYFRLLGPDGEPVPWAFLGVDNNAPMPRFPEGERRFAKAMESVRRKAKRESITSEQLELRIQALRMAPPPIVIDPGASFNSLPWAYDPYPRGGKPGDPAKKPREGYTEMPFFDLSKPGEYRIQAVFDQVPPEELRKRLGDRPEFSKELGAVRLETAWIRFRVGP
ncbi:MAG: hypothetical protein COV48_02685 [Elusimicrobia bacterium CG11_big_fil_rev_8_21_14_0_20_64_6]|nr:MAG: hypothetical protein COV48_02685 [Elusimicrobia bacterium CG11_big_fil_rev_8_21_14_0_20_64_6]